MAGEIDWIRPPMTWASRRQPTPQYPHVVVTVRSKRSLFIAHHLSVVSFEGSRRWRRGPRPSLNVRRPTASPPSSRISVMASVGQVSAHAPHETHVESLNPLFRP